MITHLNQPHPDWGLDCIDNTPDDDPDNVGDDECAAGFSWDWRICRCVGQSSVCPTGVCVQTSYDPFNCDCKTPAELEEMADHSLGEDCIPGTADDPVPDDPNDCAKPCPSDEVWNYDICQCVTAEPCEIGCSGLTPIKDPKECMCISEAEFKMKYGHDLDEKCCPKDDDCHCHHHDGCGCGCDDEPNYPIVGGTDDFPVDHYGSQEDCDALTDFPPGSIPFEGYTFNQDACACFWWDDTPTFPG